MAKTFRYNPEEDFDTQMTAKQRRQLRKADKQALLCLPNSMRWRACISRRTAKLNAERSCHSFQCERSSVARCCSTNSSSTTT